MGIYDRKFNGDRLYELRLKFGWNLREAQKKSGISHTHICNLEASRTNPGVKTISKLCKAFKVKPIYFFANNVQA